MKFLVASLWMVSLFGAAVEGQRSSAVRVVPVDPSPEPDTVETRIAFPKEGEVKTSNPVTVQLRLEAYPLGVYSDFIPRAQQVRDTGQGQSLHIIIDGKEYFSVNEAIDDVAENEEIDYDQIIETRIPYKLSHGIHVIRAFPVRSFNESLKGATCFTASYFYFGKAEESPSIDLSKPYLTYNQPDGTYSGKQPIMLDFYVTNTQLSKDGYKVRLTIDNSDKRILTSWVPYYIYGLSKGSHTLKLELLDPNDKVVPPLFNDLQRTIMVK